METKDIISAVLASTPTQAELLELRLHNTEKERDLLESRLRNVCSILTGRNIPSGMCAEEIAERSVAKNGTV